MPDLPASRAARLAGAWVAGLWTLASPRVALAAGALFALHPLHTEAVAGLVGRADVLATLLGALAWWLHRRRVPAATLLAPLCLGGALLAKESAVLILPL